MLLLQIQNLETYIGERLLFNVPDFSVYKGDRIGLVGLNGAGKSTFLNMISGDASYDSGRIERYGTLSYVKQFEQDFSRAYLSGGEKEWEKLQEKINEDGDLLLLDEPTSNLSLGKIIELEKRLLSYKGGIMIISHDKSLLNGLCNKIVEIAYGEVKQFSGNYDFYKAEKMNMIVSQNEQYEKHVKEKNRLTKAVDDALKKSKSMKKAPSRMGNSEARLHIGEIRRKAGKVAQSAKIIEARLDIMEEVKKPIEHKKVIIDIQEERKLYSKVLIEAKELHVDFGNRLLFSEGRFKINNGEKVALIGENGIGKSILVKMIMNGHENIKRAMGLKIGYFSQDLTILDESQTILANVSQESKLPEAKIRTVLARMLFTGADVFKKVEVLSGGEKVKVALCKIFLQDVNMLILDEPNNYLDIDSAEALEELISNYGGTVLMATHSRDLIKLADKIITIHQKEIISFHGNYEEYLEDQAKASKKGSHSQEFLNTAKLNDSILKLEYRLSLLIGQISSENNETVKKQLDEEFFKLNKKILSLKELLKK